MMCGELLIKVNLMGLVGIFTQPTALLQQEYFEPATMSQVFYFVSRNWPNNSK